jgi:hypothetical protein
MVLPPDDAWARYARVVVEIEVSAQLLVVHAAPIGEVGDWPWIRPEPIHILTAWDPGEQRRGLAANRREQARLEADLRPQAVAMWAARGADVATGARDEGVAVRGLDEEAVRAFGARYGQDAIFSWSPHEWAVVSCAGTRRVASGWALGPPP